MSRERKLIKSPKVWTVYLLSNGRRSYIGSTTDVYRRLRQHNGEIVGGARSTRKGRPWRIHCYLHGFENRSVACRWEKLLKLRARGLDAREGAFLDLYRGICPKGRKHYEPPTGLSCRVPAPHQGGEYVWL